MPKSYATACGINDTWVSTSVDWQLINIRDDIWVNPRHISSIERFYGHTTNVFDNGSVVHMVSGHKIESASITVTNIIKKLKATIEKTK